MNCLYCGGELISTLSSDDDSKFCSCSCEYNYYKKSYNHKCLQCKGQIQSFNNTSGFCSPRCQSIYEYGRQLLEIPQKGFFEQLKDIIKNFRL